MLFGLSLQQRIPQSLLKYLTQRANQWPFGMSNTFYPQSSLFPRLGTSSNYAGLHTMSLDFVSSWHWQVSRTTRPISPVVVVQSLVSSWHWQVSRTTSPISPVVVVQSFSLQPSLPPVHHCRCGHPVLRWRSLHPPRRRHPSKTFPVTHVHWSAALVPCTAEVWTAPDHSMFVLLL